MTEIFQLEVTGVSGKLRLDSFCNRALEGMTRSKLKAGVQSVQLNGKSAKLSSSVQTGDHITVIWSNPIPDFLVPENLPLRIMFEDEDVIVVNKQAGLVTHPAAGNWTGTLVQALYYYRLHASPICDEFTRRFEMKQGKEAFTLLLRTGIVHRLDKETSGALITARNTATEVFLKEEFKRRRAEKYYLAILYGVPKKEIGVIETSVFRDGHARIRFAASEELSKGKYARSRYKVLRVYGHYALTMFKIDTGRTHQIRLHARFIGCPVLGDTLYGKKKSEWNRYGLMLHAYRLQIRLPSTQEKHTFIAPLPRRFFAVLRKLQAQKNG